MEKWCNNRLTVLGPRATLQRFVKSHWDRRLHARHIELLENSPRRFVSTFETDEPPLPALRGLSRRWPDLLMFLDYRVEAERIKGLAKIQKEQLQNCLFSY